MDKAIVDFDRPPVTEVICGIGFKEPSGFQAPHMGLFWGALSDEFPVVEVKGAIGAPGEDPVLTVYHDTPAPVRFFLRSRDRTELVQIQPNRLLYNWLKTEANNTYPRYRGVIKRFRYVRRCFTKFLKDNNFGSPAIRELRLEYLNTIPFGEGWKKPGDISRLFPDFKYRRRGRRYLQEPTGFNIASRHPVTHDESHLDLSLRTVQKGDQRQILLQLSVIGRVMDPSEKEAQEWFDMAREAIDLSFIDLSSQYAKSKIWGIHEH